MATTVTYRSYAKINLYLDVVRRRRDGYHNIETIFQTVSLFDEVQFAEQSTRISLSCSEPSLELAEGNLVVRAAALLQERTGCTQGVHVHLEKRIPIAAGLAGGSGNAAAALIALNRLWELKLSEAQVRQLALELGSDVPYCTLGGTVAGWGRGEQLQPLPPLPHTWFVLVHPEIAVSASRAYNSPVLAYSQEKPFAGWTRSFRGAMERLQQGDIASVVFNRLETPVFADHPNLAQIRNRLREEGCVAAAMSGSGSTVFGVCKNQRQAKKIAGAFEDCRTSVVSTVPKAVERM